MYSYGSPHTAAQKQDDQHERTFSSYVRIQVVVLKTCLGRWTIGRSGERGPGISVLPARYDDDDIADEELTVRKLSVEFIFIENTENYENIESKKQKKHTDEGINPPSKHDPSEFNIKLHDPLK